MPPRHGSNARWCGTATQPSRRRQVRPTEHREADSTNEPDSGFS